MADRDRHPGRGERNGERRPQPDRRFSARDYERSRPRDDDRDQERSDRRFTAERDDNEDGLADSWNDDHAYSREQSRRRFSAIADDHPSFGSEGGGGSSFYQGSAAKRTGRAVGEHRSDDDIRQEVRDLLAGHPEVDAPGIDVSVKDGNVTLSGLVMERRIKRLAEECIDDVHGIGNINNQIRVGPMSNGGAIGNVGKDNMNKKDDRILHS